MIVHAVIPARAGSVRIYDKNIRQCAGRPLLAWSIEAALAARTVSRVIVSSDSAKYREMASALGAEAIDQPGAGHASRIESALRYSVEQCGRPDMIVTLQPTCPVRRPGLIDDCVVYLAHRPSLASVFTANPAGVVYHLDPVSPNTALWVSQFGARRIPQSQGWADFDERLMEDGSVFVTRVNALLEQDERRAQPAWPIRNERTVDIDVDDDFRLAEMMLRARERVEGVA